MISASWSLRQLSFDCTNSPLPSIRSSVGSSSCPLSERRTDRADDHLLRARSGDDEAADHHVRFSQHATAGRDVGQLRVLVAAEVIHFDQADSFAIGHVAHNRRIGARLHVAEDRRLELVRRRDGAVDDLLLRSVPPASCRSRRSIPRRDRARAPDLPADPPALHAPPGKAPARAQ